MSYILDALRRADSERERGAVPGVHAQQVPLGTAEDAAPPASRLWVGVSLALAVVLIGLLAWQLGGRDAPPGPAEPVRSGVAPLPVSEAVPAPPEAPAAVTQSPAVPAAPVAPPTSPPPRARAAAPVAAAVAIAPAARRAVSAAAAVGASAVLSAPARASVAAVAPPAAAPAVVASAASVTARLPTLNELPEEVQRSLPVLAIGGASYSQNPESRMLIVNGQVFREGDRIAPDVSLEQIRLKEAVLSSKGRRWRIAY